MDEWLWGQCTLVDACGRRVAVHTPRVWLEIDEREGVTIPCGFCFERSFLPPRFPPRCNECAADNLCWRCREPRAVAGVTPVPTCHQCRDAPLDFLFVVTSTKHESRTDVIRRWWSEVPPHLWYGSPRRIVSAR